MSTITKIGEVLRLQESMNSVVNPKWKTAGYPFYRAAWIEAAEMCDHLNFKWWKGGDGNIEQAKMEVVDMFHFVLSDAIIHGRTAEFILGAYTKAESRKHKAPASFKEHVFSETEAFIEIMLTEVRQGRGVPFVNFFDVVVAIGMSLDELIVGYIEKNVLNRFRQDFGYKNGTYVKEWDGQEDNVWLVKFQAELGDALTFESLYDKLRVKYQEVISK